MNWSVPHYLDASVASKIFSKEDDWREIDEYIMRNNSYHCWITEFVYFEVLNVLKLKWIRGDIDKTAYHSGIYEFNSWIDEGLIQIDSDFDMKERKHFTTLREIVDQHDIDYSDALQILTVLEGRWKGKRYECTTVFVSADAGLVKAARCYDLRVWHYGKEHPPTIAQQNGPDNAGKPRV